MLKVVYSNSMMQLAASLAEKQQLAPLPPLEAETIIVQSNELSRWLSLYLANQHGVSSHIEFPYPSAYIWSLFRSIWPDVPPQSAYSKDAMAWQLYQLLEECKHLEGFEAVSHYLADDIDPVKRFNLAHRIADSFDQYLMYRPDWVQQWETANSEQSLPHWQARLWHRLTQHETLPKHRANLLKQLEQLLSTDEKLKVLPQRLSIIGITALPPVYLRMFELMAKQCEVTLYFLSPSASYWGDLLTLKQQAKQHSLFEDDNEELFSYGHPLLASLGKQGQEFFEQLQQSEHEPESYFIEPEPIHLLGQLKADIFNLQHIEGLAEKTDIAADDTSIQVHSCHSATREIEVLFDQILAMLEADPNLSPTDFVVMTPDIERYAAAIDAVFASAEPSIPYSIADCGIRYQHTLVMSFLDLLALPQSRFDVESVLAFLDNEAIRQRFGIAEESLPIIKNWLRDTHTRWGLNAQDKRRFDLPETEANTWRVGLDRLLLAYALPQANQPGQLFESKLAFTPLSSERAELMANLCAFIDALDTIRTWLQRPQTATQWQQTLNNVLELVFQSHDQLVESELTTIRKTFDQLVDCAELAGFEQVISLELVSEWLTMHLDSEETQSRFMGNGITFCGMVPMRSIPFDVVCLIGMNDDSYPRRQPKVGFDLLANDFRIGDRSRREDDRYLFLEAVLSAQAKLYISYVGASIHDNVVIPPSVLVSDLRDVLTLSYSVNGDELWPHIFTQHPLQAFSRRYFNQQDDKLFSYQQHNCPDTVTSASTNWFEKALPEADKTWREVSITQLINFYRHPVRYILTERLGLRLELDDDQLDIREPFQLDGLDAWQLRQQLLSAKLADNSIQDIHQYVEASGVLPQGVMGEQLFYKQQQQVDVFADTVLTNYPDSMLEAERIDLQLGEFQLNGQLQSLSSQGQFFYRMAKTKGSDILAAWIQHLVLNIVKPNAVLLDTVLLTEDGHYHFKPVSDAEIHLQQLLDLYWQGLHQPLAFFNNTSFAYAKAALNEKSRANPDNAMWTAWLGGQFANAEADDLYLQQVFEGQLPEEQLKQLAEMVYTPIQNALEDNKL